MCPLYLDSAFSAAGGSKVKGEVIHIVLHWSGVCNLKLSVGCLLGNLRGVVNEQVIATIIMQHLTLLYLVETLLTGATLSTHIPLVDLINQSLIHTRTVHGKGPASNTQQSTAIIIPACTAD